MTHKNVLLLMLLATQFVTRFAMKEKLLIDFICWCGIKKETI